MQGIYVVAPRWDGPCKIGITSDPKRRLGQLMTGSCERLTVAYYAVYASKLGGKFRFIGRALEFAAHKTLADCDVQRHGEWFDVSVPDAVAVVKKCAEIMGAREITLADIAKVDPTSMEGSDRVRAAQRKMMQDMAAGRAAEAEDIING